MSALCGLILIIGAERARAQTPEELIAEGISLREQGQDAQALPLFERAYERSHSARALAQIAATEMALQRWADAEAHFVVLLGMDDDYLNERRREEFNARLAEVRTHSGTLTLSGGAPGARIAINGVRREETFPLNGPLTVVQGTLRIEVRADGYQAFRQTIEVGPQGAQLAVNLVALPPDAPPDPEPDPTLLSTAPVEINGVQADAIAGWAFTGVGVVAVLVTGIWYSVKLDQLNAEPCADCATRDALQFEHDLLLTLSGLATGLIVGGLFAGIHLTLSGDAGIDRGLPELIAAGALAVAAAGIGVYWADRQSAWAECDRIMCPDNQGIAIQGERNTGAFLSMAFAGAAVSTALGGLLALNVERRGGRASIHCNPLAGGISCRGEF